MDEKKSRTVNVDFALSTALWMLLRILIGFFLAICTFFVAGLLLLIAGSWGEFPWWAITLLSLLIFVFLTSSVLWFLGLYFTPTLHALNINVPKNVSVGDLVMRRWLSPILRKIFSAKLIMSEHEYSDYWDEWREDIFSTPVKIQHPKLLWIFLINLFLGGTIIFWLVAFFWSYAPGTVREPIISDDYS